MRGRSTRSPRGISTSSVEPLGCSIEIVVAVAYNPAKETALFTAAERVAMIREALADLADRVTVDAFNGLLVEYCDRVGAHAIIRGLRAVSDFEYEFQMAMMNRHLNARVETYFMTASEAYFYTASRLVKEVASLGGDVRRSCRRSSTARWSRARPRKPRADAARDALLTGSSSGR